MPAQQIGLTDIAPRSTCPAGQTRGAESPWCCPSITLSDDGYLPAPLTLASAIAARTEHLVINVAAVVATLHHPIELAEQMVVLDHISRGRVMYVLGLGYRSAEFELYDVALADRVQRLELVVERLRQAFDGMVTPPPFTTGGPSLAGGGGTVTAARRRGATGARVHE